MNKYLNLDNSYFSKIMNFMILNSSTEFFITEIANGTGVIYKHTKIILKRLCSFNILNKIHKDGGVKYMLNIENEIVKQFLNFHNAVCKQSDKIRRKFL